MRRSIELDPDFARAHRNLALALLQRVAADPWKDRDAGRTQARMEAARKELDLAARLDPQLPLSSENGMWALLNGAYAVSEQHYRVALQESPDEVVYARLVARSIVSQESRGHWSKDVAPLVERFADDGELHALQAVALAREQRWVPAAEEFARARQLGSEPREVLSAQAVEQIEAQARPYVWARRAGWTAGGFVVVYGLAMALMAGGGVLLARRTRGEKALTLLARPADELVQFGQVARVEGESLLARLYMLSLMTGLVLFYAAIPFLVVGLLAATGGLLYGILMRPRIPIKLVVIVVIVGLGMAWAVLKSVFARPGRGSFGLQKTATDCPRLHDVVKSVAQRVDTAPVDEIYLAPGSEIGVHQEGRGPFGLLGVKRRVLTLGMSTMRYLTLGELKAILAHEYGHFSHKDTFYSRFIHQVTMSIEEALQGMGKAGGQFNYVNPFFWCLYCYYKAYSLLAAGFSRSREFLADRMAVSLFGKQAFISSGLRKVAVDGTLFEQTIYGHVAHLLSENKAFRNMYEAFDQFRGDQEGSTEREKLEQHLHDENGSLFASHPTFSERVEAVQPFPDPPRQEDQPALSLFDSPDKIEEELTEFLTGFVHSLQLRAQAAAAG